jgi:hypothetical protein
MKSILSFFSLFAIAFLSFVATAFAAEAATSDAPADMFKALVDAARSGQYALAGFTALSALVALAWRYGGKFWPWLNTGEGKALLTLVGGFAATVCTGLAGGGALSAGLLWSAVGAAATLAGGYALLKELVVPRLVWLQGRKWMPGWAKTVIDLALWVFAKDRATVAKAEAAGQAAVDATPTNGLSGAIGVAREYP